VIETMFNDEGRIEEDVMLRCFVNRKKIKKKRKRKKKQSVFSRNNFQFNKGDHSWTVMGDYSPKVDKIPRVTRVKKKNPHYANAFANNAICDSMFLDFNISKLRISNRACELDQTNKFYNGCGRAKLNEYFLHQYIWFVWC
jgi:hypothetical protein